MDISMGLDPEQEDIMDGQSFLECINSGSIAPLLEFDSDESDMEDVSRAEVRRTLSEEEVGDCTMLLEASRAHQLCLEESHPRDDSDEDVHAMSSDDDSLGSDGSTDGEEKCCLQLLINL